MAKRCGLTCDGGKFDGEGLRGHLSLPTSPRPIPSPRRHCLCRRRRHSRVPSLREWSTCLLCFDVEAHSRLLHQPDKAQHLGVNAEGCTEPTWSTDSSVARSAYRSPRPWRRCLRIGTISFKAVSCSDMTDTWFWVSARNVTSGNAWVWHVPPTAIPVREASSSTYGK
jgi:hypothetical protein